MFSNPLLGISETHHPGTLPHPSVTSQAYSQLNNGNIKCPCVENRPADRNLYIQWIMSHADINCNCHFNVWMI